MKALAAIAFLLMAGTASAFQLETTWVQTDDTNTVWYVAAYWGPQLGSQIGPIVVAVPKAKFDAAPIGQRTKVNSFFDKLERHEDDLTPAKLAAFMQGLPNNIDLHVYFCELEGMDQYDSLIAGNVTTGRPALRPIQSEIE